MSGASGEFTDVLEQGGVLSGWVTNTFNEQDKQAEEVGLITFDTTPLEDPNLRGFVGLVHTPLKQAYSKFFQRPKFFALRTAEKSMDYYSALIEYSNILTEGLESQTITLKSRLETISDREATIEHQGIIIQEQGAVIEAQGIIIQEQEKEISLLMEQVESIDALSSEENDLLVNALKEVNLPEEFTVGVNEDGEVEIELNAELSFSEFKGLLSKVIEKDPSFVRRVNFSY